jgi:hypothetical protein
MADFGGLSEIADSLAWAAIDPSHWDSAMDTAAKATGRALGRLG